MAIQESKGKVIALSVVLPAFATSVCLLRLRARFSRKHPFKLDDYLILLSLVRDPAQIGFFKLNVLDLSMG